MYNVFKRPMFKLGGQADQGTGIMSHVEPRSNYMFGSIAQPLTPFQNNYMDLPAYAYGGRIGYQTAGRVTPGQVENPFAYFAPNKNLPGTLPPSGIDTILEARRKFDEQQRALQQTNRQALGLPSLDTTQEDGSFFDKLLLEKGLITPNATKEEKIKALKGLAVEEGKQNNEGTEKGTKNYKTVEGKTTDPREEIRKEADMLKSLLRDEGLTTAENALIVARALATPGGINAKIAAAGEMALPVLRERAKLDKEAALEAYKESKAIEKARISAGALSAQQKLIEQEIKNQKDLAIQSGKVTYDADGTVRYDGLTEAEIRDRVQAPIFGKYTSKEAFEKEQRVLKLEKNIQDESLKQKPDLNQIQKWKDEVDVLKKYYKFKANGGRINKATGGMSTEDTTADNTTTDRSETTETIVDTNVQGFPEKPVQKLTFEQIRNRLPKEITDDIVRLLANSSEALQDFAYIKTQQDVNKFNVKYGVNLVLPQNA